MSHFRVNISFTTLLIGTLLLFIGAVVAVPFAFAQQTLVCPTPEGNGQGTLQLTTCYLITPTLSQVNINEPTTTVTAGLPSPTTSSIPVLDLPLPTTTPVPPGSSGRGSTCQADSLATSGCSCPSYQESESLCADPQCSAHGGISLGAMIGGLPGIPAGANCAFPPGKTPPAEIQHSCVTQCNSKPIIYLYPTEVTNVDVRIELQGRVTVSDPLYPEGGWKNVKAYPNGTLIYQGKYYHELYYESETIEAAVPDHGVFIPVNQLRAELKRYTTDLGLNAFEQGEFLDYWVPELEKLNQPYILFSVYSEEEKVKVDDVHITPKPDTFIGFLAYFKAVKEPYDLKPLQLPQPPAREGFTAVEWGGAIDRK